MIFTSPQCLVHSIFFDFEIFFKNWRIQTPFLNIISPQRRQQTEVGSGGGGGEHQQGGEDEEGVDQQERHRPTRHWGLHQAEVSAPGGGWGN